MGTSYYELKIKNRSLIKKKGAKSLRREGLIPGVLYFKGEPTENIEVNKNIINKAINSGQRIFEIQLDGEKRYSMIKEIQYHPVTDDIIHLDLMRVRRSEKITIVIPLTLVGEAIGVKEGGVLTQSLNQVEIQCFPTDVPEQIELDVSNLEINNSYSVSDLTTQSDEITITSPPEINVVSIHMPVEEEETVEEDEMDMDSDDQSENVGDSVQQDEDSKEQDDASN
tara:strand:+ start:33 stop:707 length:675 start_codon:yes stop_codon:yes gene_type:complete